MSKNDQNTCVETPDTTPNARLRYSSLSEDIPLLLALSVCKVFPETAPSYRMQDGDSFSIFVLLYVEKKQRYGQLNMHNVTAKLVMCHLHKFHHSYRFKVRNSL